MSRPDWVLMIVILTSFLNLNISRLEANAESTPKATVEEATRFVEKAEAQLLEDSIAAERAAWVQANFITYDTQLISASAEERLTIVGVELAEQAKRFDNLQLTPDLRRRIDLLKLALTSPVPSDPKLARESAQIAAKLKAMYGEGKYCAPGKAGEDCLDVNEVTKIFAESRDPAKLLEVWKGWHAIAPPMRADYKRFVELQNQGASELGYREVGTFWRAKYDMPPDDFAVELERLWTQVRPLYESLHCYVRAKLGEKYGTKIVPQDGPIPAHLLGNIWAQDWSNIYDLVAPAAADPGYDLTKIIQAKKLDAKEMTKIGEAFFVSLGLDSLPKTFWDRSLFTKPRDREVVCHASAWDIDQIEDLRIKMCIEPNAEDFRTIHHELGHNFYQRAYNQLPFIYRQGANDGFHEAIGDTITLSVTPAYLKQIGFIQTEPPASKDIGLLLKDALEGVAFLPFGLLIDQWRWKVFSGEIKPEAYNKTWWELREKYQGVSAPLARTESDFDPGAKYHVPANVPYTRYFLARILQYQFHRALCESAGYKGVLNRCTIYGNKAAGERFKKMLEMGISRPWPDALEAATGERKMDGTALIEYYAPLKGWLEKQNEGRKCGWFL